MESGKTSPERTTQPAIPSGARRRLLGRTQIWAGSLLVLAIVFMANYLAFRHYARWDWTTEGRFTLSDRSEQVLARLSQVVDVYVFLGEREPNFSDLRELLERYRAKSDKVVVHYVDPDRRPSEYQKLLQRFGVRAAVMESGDVVADVAAIFVAGERNFRVNRDDLLSIDFDSMSGGTEPKVDVKAERALTGGLLEVTEGKPTKVCLTQGHGEWSVEGSGEHRTLWALEEEMKRSNVTLDAFATLGATAVPEDCDAVFVVGPVRAFAETEAELLTTYVKKGGSLLLALDPILERDRVEPTGLEGLAREFGIRIGKSVVLELDAARRLTESPIEAFVANRYGAHATVKPFAASQLPIAVRVARGLEVIEGSSAVSVLETSDKAYAESDIAQIEPEGTLGPGEDDQKGPVPLAVAFETEKKGDAKRGGRLVVVADADWLSPVFLNAPQFANLDLASAWTGFLTEREALISIAPRKVSAAAVLMTEDDLWGVFFRVLVLIPAAVLLMGVAVFWSRRS